MLRSAQIAEIWRLIARMEAEEIATHSTQPGLRSLKGLMFVQMYSAYEFTVVHCFAAAIRSFNRFAIPFAKTRRSILGLVLHSRFQSLKQLADRRSWSKRVDFLMESESVNSCSISDTLFPMDDSHFRSSQLETICQLLGIPLSTLMPEPRLHGWITEVVENRNAIAHGRETAEAIGSRYSSASLQQRLQQLDVLCNHILTALEAHSNLEGNFRDV